jgi:DNA-binding Lrp family transcriptional regulator
MDAIDRKLLNLLTQNSRTPSVALARALGVSRTTVQNRIERLRKKHVIKNFTVALEENFSLSMIRGLMTVHVRAGNAEGVERDFQKIAPIIRCLSVSGPYDYLLEIEVENIGDFDQVIANIRDIPDVRETQSAIVLKDCS